MINESNFKIHEIKILGELNHKLDKAEASFSFEYDNSIQCAKCNTEFKVIRLCEDADFSDVVHEFLHAKLVYIHNFPSFYDINKLKNNRSFYFTKQLIVDITNDIHHFIFWKEFRQLTTSDNIVNNQVDLINSSKTDFKYIEDDNESPRDRSNSLIEFYSNYYIPQFYKNIHRIHDFMVKPEIMFVPDQYDFLYEFFIKVLESNRDKDIIIDAYKQFLNSLDIYTSGSN